ncbi:addiction module toxin RelE [Janthinobacterium sp. BJB412]|nr:addiction module toxin RelE [Janthinobacterium sp. BJB412]
MSLHDDFEPEFEALAPDIQEQLLALARAVEIAGPKAGRPHVDTLKQSKHANMKEMRFTSSDGRQVWRAAFAFDPERQGIILVAADKQGISDKLFYKRLIDKADKRFDAHLKTLATKTTRKQ